MSQATSGAVAAAPSVRPVLDRPFGRPHWLAGNQRSIVPPMVTGKNGPFATPTRNRASARAPTVQATGQTSALGMTAVTNVSKVQRTAIAAIVFLGPNLSPIRPPGNWKIA